MTTEPLKRLAFAALLAGAVGIAFAPIFVRWSQVGPAATAFYRVALALPVLWLWMSVEQRGTRPPPQPLGARQHWQLIVAGLFFAADLALWHWSIRLTTVANATLFANFTPIFVTLGARLLFGEWITRRFVAGLVLALSGAAMVGSNSLQLGLDHLGGDLLGVAAAVFYAAYMLAVKHLRKTFSTATLMVWSGASATPALLGVAAASGERLLPPTAAGWGVLIALAMVSQVGGQGLIAYAFAHLRASFSSVSLLLQPAVAALLAWLLLDEPLQAIQVAGAVIILGGICVAGRAGR